MAQLTALEALDKLNEYTSIEGLAHLTSLVTGKVMDATEDAEHFLYAYNLNSDGSGINAVDVVKQATASGKGVWIEQSEVGKFLDDQAFKDRLHEVSGLKAQNIAQNSTEFRNLLYGIPDNINSTRTNGFWDIGSKSYVEDSNGIFRVIAPHAGSGTTLALTETQAIIDRADIGLSVEVRGGSGNLGHLIEDVQKSGSNAKEAVADYLRMASVTAANEFDHILASGGTVKLSSLIGNAKDVIVGLGSKLSHLGPYAAVVAAGFVANDANAAYQQGDNQKGDEIVKDYFAGLIGDAVVDVTFGGLAVAGIAAATTAGIAVSAPVGVAIGIAAAIGGSIFYGEEAKKAVIDIYNNATNSNLDRSTITQILNKTKQALAEQGIGYGVSSSIPGSSTLTNPTIFDLSTDPAGLNPTGSDNLGNTTHGEGLLAVGAGYNATMASTYVNGSGIANTVASNLVADATRPGNHSLNRTDDVINAIRAINFSRPKLELIAPDTLSPEEEANRISLLMQTAQDADNLEDTDPLSLDAGGDGIRLGTAPVNFDLNADGSAEAVSWTAPTDPLLVLDANGDGRINNGSELVDLTGTGAPLNLFSLDGDAGGVKDGVLDASDAGFSQLQIWSDRNRDGYASAEELQGLSDLGIVSIDLDTTHLQTSTVAGQEDVKGVVATYTDGSHKTLWDVPFDPAPDTPAVTTIAYGTSGAIDKIEGSGQTALVAKSAFGVALDLNGSGADQAIGSFGNDTLTGTAGNDWLTGGAGSDSFNAGDGADLLIIDAEDQQANIDAGAGIDTVLVADDRGVFLNLAKTRSEVVYGGYGDDVFVGGGADNYFIDGAAGDDLIIGGSADDVLSGGDGADVLEGLAGDDLIRGHRGNDQLLGGDGNDVLDGGLDDDTLDGGNGNDVIIASGGSDTVDGGAGIDMIELKGQLEDYSFIHSTTGTQADFNNLTDYLNWSQYGVWRSSFSPINYGSWIIIDHKNTDGSLVDAGQVSDRDGVQNIKNIEKFSYKRGNSSTVMNFATWNPLPVNDQINNLPATGSITIASSTLLGNDLSFMALNGSPQILQIKWVGDAIGGTVAFDGSNVVFTPAVGYSGPMEFNYQVRDIAGNSNANIFLASTIQSVVDPNLQGEAKARVLLTPAAVTEAPTDPEFIKQWYLGAINAQSAWNDGYSGKGVNVLILEPSGQYAVARQAADLNHADLVANKSARFGDTAVHSVHATAVAGVIGAARNGVGGVGVAYNANLNSIGFTPGSTLQEYKDDLSRRRDYDIVNNSWSYDNPWNNWHAEAYSDIQRQIDQLAIEQAATEGRNGLGTVLVFGAGNDRAKGYDAGLSSLTNNAWTINVGAINRVSDIGSGGGINKPFSNRGANILIAAPGSNIVTSGVQIETANGSVIGSDSQETQGTSFAAPIVSGVAALMLQANPHLTYRDVQTILAMTARKDLGDGTQGGTVWASNANADWNGSGMHYSHDFGFGLVDAAAAVRVAENWVPASQGPSIVNAWQTADVVALADLGTQTVSFEVAEHVELEQAIVKMHLAHERWSDLVVTLVSPHGTRSVLLDRTGLASHLNNTAGEIDFDQQLMSVHFRGEDSAGTWQLVIEDQAAGAAGSGAIFASLELVGSSDHSLKRYLLTDEYAGNWTIADIPAEARELNAAAVTTGMRIDLSGASYSSVNGQALLVNTGIDRLVGGAGNDTLLGTANDETIFGSDGADTIEGLQGNDRLEGGRGNDNLYGGSGSDYLDGGLGENTLHGGEGNDVLIGGKGNDTLYGDAGGDVFLIDGDSGNTQTIIQDFNASEGDTLRIRSRTAPTVTQTLVGNNLELTFNVAEGARKVILNGVAQTLSGTQLALMGENEQPDVDQTGGFTGRKVVTVAPIATVIEIPPVKVDAGMSEQRYARQWSGEPNPNLYIVFHVSEGRAKIPYDTGKSIAIGFGSNRYVTLPPNVLEATWAGVKQNGDDIGPALLWETVYSNNGRSSISVDLAWPEGSNANELLIAGNIAKPDPRISDADWQQALQRLGARTFSGGGGNDELLGDASAEIMDGGSGNDKLVGAGGNDQLTGGSGDDEFVFGSGHGQDVIDDLESNDLLHFNGISNLDSTTHFTSSGRNNFSAYTLLTDSAVDSVSFTANYTVEQLALNDIVLYRTQLGDAAVTSKIITGKEITEFSDVIVQEKLGSNAFDTLAGDDVVFALKQNQLQIKGGDGNDTIYALEGQNIIEGGMGDDRIEALAGTDLSGQDTLIGGAGNDSIKAGDRGAEIYGDDPDNLTSGDDSLLGGQGEDRLYGGGGEDKLFGGSGADQLYGGSGWNALYGEAGDDFLYGGDDGNILDGGQGLDALYGGTGSDVLSGGAGDDILYGDDGDDILIGGENNDTLIGGLGSDTFIPGSGHNVIELGLDSGNDLVTGLSGVDRLVFRGLSYRSQLGLELLNNGGSVKLTWGSDNSLILNDYILDVGIIFDQGTLDEADDNTTTKLRDVFNDKGFNPDESFDFIGQYDLKLQGDPSQIGIRIGSENDDKLYGGPLDGTEAENPAVNGTPYGAANSAYWYVLAREGDDNLAGGLSGAILDGGYGNDKFRGSNGITVVRDSFQGGQDTLIMPEGVTPEMLRFYRVPNPFEASILDDHQAADGATVQLIGAEALLPNPLLPAFTAWTGARYIGIIDWHSNTKPDFSNQHFDTLRIQSLDGKYTVDVVSYFESGKWKNDITDIVFTTVFDAEGNSLNLKLDALLENNVKGGVFQRGGSYGTKAYFPDLALARVVVASEANRFVEDVPTIYASDYPQVLIGGDDSATLTGGKMQINLTHFITRYSGVYTISHNNWTEAALVSAKQYSQYKNYSSYLFPQDSEYLAGTSRIFNGLSYFADVPTETLTHDVYMTAVALADKILGFDGDDVIKAGGTFIEAHKIGSGYAERYYNSTSVGSVDQVNGGNGDDTYVYRNGDGDLHIIAIDSPASGADGMDILDLSDFLSGSVGIQVINESGALNITLQNKKYNFYAVDDDSVLSLDRRDSTMRYANIIVDSAVDGELQVDKIRFWDTDIDVRELINQQLGNQFTAADSRIYSKTKLATPPEGFNTLSPSNFSALAQGLLPDAIVNGTPAIDIIRVPNSGLVQGFEGGDRYAINTHDVDFAVITMDRDDIVRFGFVLPIGVTSIQYLTESSVYLGQTWQEWDASGLKPYAVYPKGGASGPTILESVRVSRTVQLGMLKPGIAGQGKAQYSIDDWAAVDDDNDTAADALINWQTVDADGSIRDHYVVLAGIVDAWGTTPDSLMKGLAARYATQGDDYIANYDEVFMGLPHSPDGSVRELFALGGNDTILAYANDQRDPLTGELIGFNDILHGGSGNDSLDGGAGNDSLYGGVGDDNLIGGYGDDLLAGGAGADQMIGGTGNDIYVVDTDDTVIEDSGSLGGIDEIRGDLDMDLRSIAYANIENATLLGNTARQLFGNNGSNRLAGNGAGSVMTGFEGDDTYIFINDSDQILETADGGVDTVETLVDIWSLANYVENIVSEGVGLNLFGNRLDNSIMGDSGNNLIDGGLGRDILIGGEGDDSYVVDSANDVVIEASGNGRDTVWTASDYSLANDQEIEVLKANTSVGLRLVGNDLDNLIVGDAGDDFLVGAAGLDTLMGGAGDDTYIVDTQADIVAENLNEGNDTIQITYNNASVTANDVVLGSGIYTNIENIIVTGGGLFNLTGDSGGNRLVGNNAINIIEGGAGNDILTGGAGNDRYIAGKLLGYTDDTIVTTDIINEDDGGAGDNGDTLELGISSQAYIFNDGYSHYNDIKLTRRLSAQGDNLEIDSLGYQDMDPWGTVSSMAYDYFERVVLSHYFEGSRYQIENIQFSDGVTSTFNNFIVSHGYQFIGSSGNDTMVGTAGVGLMVAGDGDDRLYGDAGNNGLSGGVGNDYLYGNAGDDWLAGGNGDDTLDGGSGDDWLEGGLGNDTYIVANAGDIVAEYSDLDTEIDTVQSSITYTLDVNLENLILTGTAAINGTGNTLNNVLKGNSNINILDGGVGDDTLDGGTGADTLIGGQGSDTYVLALGYGIDTIVETDTTAGNTDTAQFLSNISADQIWFQHIGNDLQASIIGTDDKLVVRNWYLGDAYHVEQFKTLDDGLTLLDSQVENLVNAMAAFAPPAAGETTLPPDYQTQLAPVLAANWH